MDFFAQLVANKAASSKTIKIRKVYVNEDPNMEETEPCPKCMARNHTSTVRYMYLNMQEAIYKCESPSCMYPYQNFKYKNYTDNTVYYYTSAAEETPPALEDFGSTFTNISIPYKDSHDEHQSVTESSSMEFNMNFHSPERSHASSKFADVSPGVNIFDSPSLSYKNLIQDFDTGFIDDILQDLRQPSPEKKPVMSPVRVMQKDSSGASRQLERCLRMFKDNKATTEAVFKVPPLPGSEVPGSPKNKSEKPPSLRRHKYVRRTHQVNNSADKISKKCRIKPLDFIESMNCLHTKEAPPADPKLAGVKPLTNQKVERMLSFIERSMKKREPTPEATIEHIVQLPQHSSNLPIKKHRVHKKPKRLSLSAAVLQDSQFDYSTSESEQEDASDSIVPSPVKSVICGLVSHSQLPPEDDPTHSLPSFEDLLSHIHPVPSKVPCHNVPEYGFRSAGSSPIRVQQWEKTPPRRIHSMESLNSILE